MRSLRAFVLCLCAAGLCGALDAVAAPAGAVRVIVNPANPLDTIDRKFVVEAFLKKATRWPNDQVILPVDLDPNSPTRRRFSEDLLDRSIAAVKAYWQQMIFSGRGVPPPELDSEGDVVSFVLRNPGGLGYVSTAAAIENAKVLSIR